MKDAEKKAEKARDNYNKAVEKRQKAEQKAIDFQKEINKLEGVNR